MKQWRFVRKAKKTFILYSIAEVSLGLVQTPLMDPEAIAQRCSVKKVFLEITQISQENTCARVSFLMKL